MTEKDAKEFEDRIKSSRDELDKLQRQMDRAELILSVSGMDCPPDNDKNKQLVNETKMKMVDTARQLLDGALALENMVAFGWFDSPERRMALQDEKANISEQIAHHSDLKRSVFWPNNITNDSFKHASLTPRGEFEFIELEATHVYEETLFTGTKLYICLDESTRS